MGMYVCRGECMCEVLMEFGVWHVLCLLWVLYFLCGYVMCCCGKECEAVCAACEAREVRGACERRVCVM